jgi:hypothetical protein
MQHLPGKKPDFLSVGAGARTFMSGAAELDKEFNYG